MSFRYYYNCLSRQEQAVYTEIFRGLNRIDVEICVPRLPYDRLAEIYQMVKYDEPAVFYAGPPSFRAYSGAAHVSLVPDYYFDKAKILQMKAAVKSRLEKLIRPSADLGEYEKVLFVHDFILEKVKYEKLTRNYSHEIYGVLFHGIGVCEGIAKTAKIMFDILDIESLVVLGREMDDGYRHAWNIVYRNGKPYHLDITFDLGLTKGKLRRYDYFYLSDADILKDHTVPVFPVPACADSSLDYYKTSRLVLLSPVKSGVMLSSALRKKADAVALKCAFAITPDSLEEIRKSCTGVCPGRHVEITANHTQRVVCLTVK